MANLKGFLVGPAHLSSILISCPRWQKHLFEDIHVFGSDAFNIKWPRNGLPSPDFHSITPS